MALNGIDPSAVGFFEIRARDCETPDQAGAVAQIAPPL
jgi:hypothetical protein